mgnify:CR=1 FL=1
MISKKWILWNLGRWRPWEYMKSSKKHVFGWIFIFCEDNIESNGTQHDLIIVVYILENKVPISIIWLESKALLWDMMLSLQPGTATRKIAHSSRGTVKVGTEGVPTSRGTERNLGPRGDCLPGGLSKTLHTIYLSSRGTQLGGPELFSERS